MSDPTRLLSDPVVSAALQADLRALRDYEVPFDLEAAVSVFEARLERGDLETDADDASFDDDAAPETTQDFGEPEPPEPSGMVAKPVPAPPAPSAGSATAGQAAGQLSASQLTAGKVLAVLAIGAGVGWGALNWGFSEKVGSEGAPSTTDAPVPSEIESPAQAPIEATPSASHEAPVAEAATEQVAPEAQESEALPGEELPQSTRRSTTFARRGAPAVEPVAAAAEPEPAVEVEPAPSPAVVTPPSTDHLLQRELAQLAEVRRALASDPQRALLLADRGHREFGEGALYQEREALALRALSALGRRQALEDRGRAFLLRYPQSSFAREVEHLLKK